MVLPRGAFTSGDGLTDQFQILFFDVVQRWLRKTRDYQILRPLNKLHAGWVVSQFELRHYRWLRSYQAHALAIGAAGGDVEPVDDPGSASTILVAPLLSLLGQAINE